MARGKKHASMPANYDPHKIVQAWNMANSPQEVADRFAMTKEQVTQLASVFRKKSVFMKNMRKGPESKIDWRELASFSKKFQKQVSQ
jgi:hypothetical protein